MCPTHEDGMPPYCRLSAVTWRDRISFGPISSALPLSLSARSQLVVSVLLRKVFLLMHCVGLPLQLGHHASNHVSSLDSFCEGPRPQ